MAKSDYGKTARAGWSRAYEEAWLRAYGVMCSECEGDGILLGKKCFNCNGIGKLKGNKNVK